MRDLAIAVDGPASAGKGTVARGLAQALDYQYIDTGAIYRGVALVTKERGISWDDAERCATVARGLSLRFVWHQDTLRVLIDGRDVSDLIRNAEIGSGASTVSAHPPVRAALLDVQRALGAEGGVVMDGRDIGTVVLPNADVKLYLDADITVRARRRWMELRERGSSISLDDVQSGLKKRDARDMRRAVAPLRPADDAVHLDCTHMTALEAVDAALHIVRQRFRATD